MKVDIKGAIVQSGDKWIYDWFGMDAVCPKDVQGAIGKAMGEALDVYINSSGGDIFAGSEIYEALRQYAGGVTIHVVGLAASAASVIACAGKSEIAPTGMVMVHNVSTQTAGDYHDMDRSSEVLQKANKAIAAAYTEKTGKPEAEVLAMMDKETWLSADEAVAHGLIDSVSVPPVQQLAAAYGSPLLPQSVIEKIRNIVRNPLEAQADVLLQKAQAELELLNLGGL